MIGFGEWSDVAYLLVATQPAAPLKPVLVSVDETHITILVPQSSDNQGSVINSYHLFINEGVDGSEFHEISTYQSEATYTISADDLAGSFTITVGGIYRLKTKASNSIDISEDSEELVVALARRPTQPAKVTFSQESNRVQNVIEWSQGESVDIPVTGYKLYSDNGMPGNQYLIY